MTPDSDLTLIDLALDEGRATTADPSDRELQELALALRADSPAPRPGFRDGLGEKVRAGFPRKRALPRLSRPRRLLPVIAAAATLLIALAVAVPLLSGAGSGGGAVQSTGSGGAAQDAAPPAAEQRSDMTEAPAP